MQGGGIEVLGREEAAKEGAEREDERLELSVPKLAKTLDPLCPDLEWRGDRLKGGNLRLRKKIDAVSVEKEAEIGRQIFRLPQGRGQHHEWPRDGPGNFPQHHRPGTSPEAV
jgi:hypothetical protein